MARRFSLPGLIALFLIAPLGGARSQTTPDASPPQFSFRSLPVLCTANGDAGRGSGLRLIFLSPFRIPHELLWQTPAPADGTETALADAAQAIREAARKSLASLTAGDAAGYVAVLAPDYEGGSPSGMVQSKADALRATQADLAEHSYTDAGFTLTDLRLATPTEAAVTMTLRLVTVTKNTPPTIYATGNGASYIQNNTVTVHRATVYHQTWTKRGADWVLVRSQAVDGVTTAVA